MRSATIDAVNTVIVKEMNTLRDKNFDNHFDLSCANVSGAETTDFNTICASEMESCHGDNMTSVEATKECLVKYRGRVYDVNDFLDYHPGGKNTLARHKDQVLDETLTKYPHSKSAYYLLEEFAVHRQERYNECEVSYLLFTIIIREKADENCSHVMKEKESMSFIYLFKKLS